MVNFFGLPLKEVDLDMANEYVSDVCNDNGCHVSFSIHIVPAPNS